MKKFLCVVLTFGFAGTAIACAHPPFEPVMASAAEYIPGASFADEESYFEWLTGGSSELAVLEAEQGPDGASL